MCRSPYTHVHVYIYMSFYLSLSIYVYIYTHIQIYIYIPPLFWSVVGSVLKHSDGEFLEDRKGKNALLRDARACGFTLRQICLPSTFFWPFFL